MSSEVGRVLNWQGAEYTLQTQPPAIGSHSPHLQQRCLCKCILRDPTSSTVLQLPNYVSLNITFSSSNFFFIARYLSSVWDSSSLSLITSVSRASMILSWGVATVINISTFQNALKAQFYTETKYPVSTTNY